MSATTCSTPALYERIGGDMGVRKMMEQLLADTAEYPSFLLFFKDTPESSLLRHQMKFFRLILGPKEERPDHKDIVNHLLLTHSRLFRNAGLNETHFDVLVTSFLKALKCMQIEQPTIDECAESLLPLRDVFEYGASVAKNKDKLGSSIFPTASATTMEKGIVESLRLEEAHELEVPTWLPQAIKKHSRQTNLRSWTAALANAFGEQGDRLIADTFLAMPYLLHHSYLLAFLQLAFRPDDQKANLRHCIMIIKYPLGEAREALCLRLWNRMIAVFARVCESDANTRMKGGKAVEALQTNLMYYTSNFPKKPYVMVGGSKSPHLLTGNVTHFSQAGSSPLHSKRLNTVKRPSAASSKKLYGALRKMLKQLRLCRSST